MLQQKWKQQEYNTIQLISQALCHEDMRGSGDIAPYFLDLGIGWRIQIDES
jgi:hypothetical protein